MWGGWPEPLGRLSLPLNRHCISSQASFECLARYAILMIPDTNVVGEIATLSEVPDDQKTTFF